MSSADINKNNTISTIGIDINIAFTILFIITAFELFLPLSLFTIASLVIFKAFPTNSNGPNTILNIFDNNSENFNEPFIIHIIIVANKDNITNIFSTLNNLLLKIKYVLLNNTIGIAKIIAFLFFIFFFLSKITYNPMIVAIVNNTTDIPTSFLKNSIECITLKIKLTINVVPIIILSLPFIIIIYNVF